MSFFSALRVALAALFVNKGRSVLTSLGIVIGIAAVIAMVAAGNGTKRNSMIVWKAWARISRLVAPRGQNQHRSHHTAAPHYQR